MKKEEIKAKSELDANVVWVACHATQNAITLISLIITIVLLLILSAVALNLTIGENGIFKLAQNAGKNYIDAQNREKNELDQLYSSIQIANDSKVTLTMEELNNYINSKVDQKIQSTVEQLNSVVNDLQEKNTLLEQKIKEKIAIPDYDKKEQITFTNKSYTVPKDGYIQIYFYYTVDVSKFATDTMFINNREVAMINTDSTWTNYMTPICPVKKGDIVTYTGKAQNVYGYYYPTRD